MILKNCGPCPPVPANSKAGLLGPARGEQRAARGEQRAARGPNFRKNPAFCPIKKLKFNSSLKQFTDF
jgi:hypothetical protein